MPVLPWNGEFPTKPGDKMDLGPGKAKITCPECKEGLVPVPGPARGIRNDPCKLCGEAGEI